MACWSVGIDRHIWHIGIKSQNRTFQYRRGAFTNTSFLFADFSDIRVDSCTDSVCLSVAGILSASRNLQS